MGVIFKFFRFRKPEIIGKTVLIMVYLFTLHCTGESVKADMGWPEISSETKPWTRWWWLGNDIRLETLPQVMEQYKDAGIGGLEITPIYGVMGEEEKFVNYLSPEWINLLTSTLKIADSLNLGIDMANASGWPFGGPWIDDEDACKNVVYRKYRIEGGQKVVQSVAYTQAPFVSAVRRSLSIDEIQHPVSANNDLYKLALAQVRFKRDLPLVALMAYSTGGDAVDLTDKVNEENLLEWEAPAGEWDVYALFQGWHGKMVERASPGGEGNVIDHFSEKALHRHLQVFESAFGNKDMTSIRAFFNDSYEVDDAQGESNFTGKFFDEFKKRRGYDLRMHLPAFLDSIEGEEHNRILCDYRETISELLLEEFTLPWKEWAHKHNAIIRNQAHGSPAVILDLYAASDIPETEGTDPINIKFASSAAHVTGKKLASAEACTWLNEHFKATLAQVKGDVDHFFLGGINHIVYHGTPYSPVDEEWPGRLFYAAVHFGPTNPFWDDFSALNNYVARCQSFLQSGHPDNDLLVYYPVYDRWSAPSQSMLIHFHGDTGDTFFRNLCGNLRQSGYSFDFVSDKQIETLSVKGNRITAANSAYKTIIIPDARLMPLGTFEALLRLAREGAHILFMNALPDDVPGFGDLNERREKYLKQKEKITFSTVKNTGFQQAKQGKGFFYIGSDETALLSHIGIHGEPMTGNSPLQYIRRKLEGGEVVYFIVNTGEEKIDKWVKLNTRAAAVICYNPMTGEYGKALTNDDGSVYMQLEAGDACILRILPYDIKMDDYRCFETCGEALAVEGDWNVSFVKGGPELPPSVVMNPLKSWTEIGPDTYKNFSGEASYTIVLNKPASSEGAEAWMLDLGEVCESAAITVNGHKLGTCFKAPYRMVINDEDLANDANVLEIRVSNLMANRISYMDREKIGWKKFYDINFPARYAENRGNDGLFNADGWEPFKSGLIGPVSLTPLKRVTREKANHYR